MSNEWYTPAKYIEAARAVMGTIDLDPASCELANQTVKASRYYTQEDNGLAQEWYGNVWLNPPYGTIDGTYNGRSNLRLFVAKLIDGYQIRCIQQAILLCRADPNAPWFRQLWEYCICFPDHHIYFNDTRGGKVKHQFGSCFVYLGWNEQAFIDVFSQFGRIAKAVDVPARDKPRQLELIEAV